MAAGGEGGVGAEAVRVTLRLSLRTDPEQAISALSRAASAAPGCAVEPPVAVLLAEIEPSGLVFEISAQPLPDVGSKQFASNLRIALLRAVRASGLELAHAQHDVHLRDLDGLRAAFAMALRERQGQSGT